MSQIVLELKGISKTFPGVKALNEMQLQVYAGEVHALMGENGAGKSTLMNIINGSYQKDSGEIYMDGRLVEIRSINDAAALGISMIHQELNYVPALTVADNIFLGRELVSGKWLQKQKMLEQAQKLLDEMEIHLDPASKMCDLSVSQQQMVEIIRAVSNNARVLIMDEPTSAITPEEVEVLFRIIDKLKKKDVAIIYITHKMDEVFRIADRVTVMRDGCYISSFPREQLEETSLISMMVGREIKNMFPKSNTPTTEEFFRVEHLTGGRFTRDNITMSNLSQYCRHSWIRHKEEKRVADEQIREFSIKTPSAEQIAANLSGGNQQKIVLSKTLLCQPEVIILDEPTRGIDVGAKAEIHKMISALASQGKGIIMISSEMPEILGMSDRIIVIHEGRKKGELLRENASQQAIMEMMLAQ